jgi:hypothetical protein
MKKNLLSEQFENQIKIVERGKNLYPDTRVHDRSLSWLGTGISI